MPVVFNDIDSFLKNNQDSNINFCVANNAVLKMVDNLLVSAKLNNISIVLFALDEKIVENMSGQCVIVKHYNKFNNKVKQNNFYTYGTSEFKNVIFQRFFIGSEILKHQKSYIYIDVDIVITKNFVNDILEQYHNTEYDCLAQYNGSNCCTGFYSMIPNTKTMAIDRQFFEKHNYEKYNTNQPFFNGIILKKKLLNIKFLNRDHYPNGSYFYKNNKEINNMCFIIHFNCIIGYEEKIIKMKKYKYWYL